MKTKSCTECKNPRKLTSEYWLKKEGTKDGLDDVCRLCRKRVTRRKQRNGYAEPPVFHSILESFIRNPA